MWLRTASGPQASTAAIHDPLLAESSVPDGVHPAMNAVQALLG